MNRLLQINITRDFGLQSRRRVFDLPDRSDRNFLRADAVRRRSDVGIGGSADVCLEAF
jgi:hypothetical protein